MVVDIVMVYNEMDLLQLRMWEMHEYVDLFVIIEARQTFTGKKKGLCFDTVKNEPRFSRFKNKIKHIVIDEFVGPDSVWNREEQQRNGALSSGFLDTLDDDDIIITSDVDEIPSWSTLKEMVNVPDGSRINTNVYWSLYYANLVMPKRWGPGPMALRVSTLKKYFRSDFQFLRCGKSDCQSIVINDAGWHISYTGKKAVVLDKLDGFSHQETNTELIRDSYGKCVVDKLCLWDNSIKLEYMPWGSMPFPESFRNDDKNLLSMFYPQRAVDLAKESRMTINGFNEANSVTGIIELIHDFVKPKDHVVEIGSFEGASTEAFALFCNTVDSIDPYLPVRGQEWESALSSAEKTFVERMKGYANVKKFKITSGEALRSYGNGTLDFVYIDGDHTDAGVLGDIALAKKAVKKGGVVAGHDYYEGVKKCIDSVIGKPDKTYRDASWAWINR